MLIRVIFNKKTRKLTNELTGESSVNLLSLSEIKILESLIEQQAGCSREMLLDAAWKGRVVTGTSLNVAINNIRKLTKEVCETNPIDAIRGFGYKLSNQVVFTMDDTRATIRAESSVDALAVDSTAKTLQASVKRVKQPLLLINICLFMMIVYLIQLYW